MVLPTPVGRGDTYPRGGGAGCAPKAGGLIWVFESGRPRDHKKRPAGVLFLEAHRRHSTPGGWQVLPLQRVSCF